MLNMNREVTEMMSDLRKSRNLTAVWGRYIKWTNDHNDMVKEYNELVETASKCNIVADNEA